MMKCYIKHVVVLFILLMLMPPAMAESRFTSNPANGSYSASARIKLRVVIPEMLSFQIADRTTTGDSVAFLSSGGIITDSNDGNIRLRGNTGQTSIYAENNADTLVTYTAASP